MPHESDWTRAAEDEFAAQCAGRGYLCAWTKISDNEKRGIPDVWAYACDNLRVGMRTCTYGPGAWIELKKGTKWPTPVQAARIFSLAAKLCPAYLIRMPNREQMELYKPLTSAADVMWKHKPPFRQLFILERAGTWAEVLGRLADLMASR